MTARLVAIATVFAATLFGADSQLLRYLPPDAALIAGVDVASARGTDFGEYILGIAERYTAHLEAPKSVTGFDPRTDLREIAVGGDSTRESDGNRVVVVRARHFDIPAISAWARSRDATVEAVDGATVISGSGPSDPAIAFPSEDVAVFGRPENIRAALDRVAAGNGLGGDVTERLTRISTGSHAWFLMTGSPAEFIGRFDNDTLGGAMQGDIIQAIKEVSGSFHFGSSVEFTAQATSTTAADAEALANVIEFFASLAQLQSDPVIAAAVRDSFGEGPTVAGNVVTVNFSMPQEELERLLVRARYSSPQGSLPGGSNSQ